MLMADVVAVFFVILGLLLAHAGVWLLCRGLWSSHVERSAQQASQSLVLSGLAGIIPVIIALVFTIVLAQIGGSFGKACAAIFIATFLLFAHAGTAGIVVAIGRKLGKDETPWRTTARGAIALSLAYLFPVLGWFLVFPLSIVMGAGASSIALVRGAAERVFPARTVVTG